MDHHHLFHLQTLCHGSSALNPPTLVQYVELIRFLFRYCYENYSISIFLPTSKLLHVKGPLATPHPIPVQAINNYITSL